MRLILLFIMSTLVVSCKNDEAQIVIDVYAPGKSKSVKPKGHFHTEPLDLYLDGEFIGTTPVSFTNEDLERLKLPQDERVDVPPNGHWNTWDIKGDGTFVISHPQSREEKKHLEFRTRDRENTVVRLFEGLTKEDTLEGGVIWLAEFPKHEAEQGGGAKGE